MTTQIHDSTTCTAGVDGQRCEMCQFAQNASQANSGLFRAEQGKKIDSSPSDASGIVYLADTVTIRAALFDALDENTVELYANDCEHCTVTDEEASENRYLLADILIGCIARLQRPPHNMGVKLENYCDYHKRRRLPRPTVSECMDCAEQGQMAERRGLG